MKKRPQLALPKTLPPLRNAKAEFWAAVAAEEQWEEEVEKAAAALAGLKAELDGAHDEVRRKRAVLREVENEASNRQEGLEN